MSQPSEPSEMREFALVLCRALMMIVQWLNKRYALGLRLKEDR